MADTPHLALPFSFKLGVNGNRTAAVNEQDTVDDVAACVTAIVRTPLGYLIESPDFGIRDQTFSQGGINTDEIQTAISQWEPRADILIEEDESMLEQFMSIARIKTAVVPSFELNVGEEDS